MLLVGWGQRLSGSGLANQDSDVDDIVVPKWLSTAALSRDTRLWLIPELFATVAVFGRWDRSWEALLWKAFFPLLKQTLHFTRPEP